jgi:hypothetical protein
MVCGKVVSHSHSTHDWCFEKWYAGKARYLTLEEQKAGVTVEWGANGEQIFKIPQVA